MNRTCDGDHFDFRGVHYYRCLKDGTVRRLNVHSAMVSCPACGRPAGVQGHHGEVEGGTVQVTVVKLTSDLWVTLPTVASL